MEASSGQAYIFVAIDRTSKFAFVEFLEATARDFLNRLVAAVPYKIHTVLTDSGIHFTTPGAVGSAMPLIREAIAKGDLFRAHAFELACTRNDIDHLSIQIHHPVGHRPADPCAGMAQAGFEAGSVGRTWIDNGRNRTRPDVERNNIRARVGFQPTSTYC